MKKSAIILGAMVFAFASCQNKGQNQENNGEANDSTVVTVEENQPTIANELFYGAWVLASGNNQEVQGFSLKSEGVAESINNTTVTTKEWWSDDSNLYLVQENVNNGSAVVDTLAFEVTTINADSLVLRDGEAVFNYTKQN